MSKLPERLRDNTDDLDAALFHGARAIHPDCAECKAHLDSLRAQLNSAPALAAALEDCAALLDGTPGVVAWGAPDAIVVLDTKAVIAAALKARAALAATRGTR